MQASDDTNRVWKERKVSLKLKQGKGTQDPLFFGQNDWGQNRNGLLRFEWWAAVSTAAGQICDSCWRCEIARVLRWRGRNEKPKRRRSRSPKQ